MCVFLDATPDELLRCYCSYYSVPNALMSVSIC